MRIPIFVFFVLACALPAPASGQEMQWAKSFESEVTAELIDTDRVIVISASDEAEEASAALVANLRGRGLELVMTDEALGDTDGLSDQQLREKGQDFPVDGVVIVRVFPSKTAPTAVIRHTFKGGATAASVVAGKPPRVTETSAPIVEETPEEKRQRELRQQESAATQSAGEIASRIPTNAISLADESRSLQRGKYQREKITYREDPWTFHLGAFEKEIGGEDLYLAMGRSDLAESYASESGFKTGFMVGSGVSVALGIGLMFVGVIPSFDDEDVNWALTGAGIGASALGIGGLIYGATLDPHPVSEEEARKLAEDHNSILRKKYGVQSE